MNHRPDAGPLDESNWVQRIDAIGPETILVLIRQWMSASLRQVYGAEDVWQETMLHAWRDRDRHEWRGLPQFRAWVLTIARHRVLDLADRAANRRPRPASLSLLSDSEANLLPRITTTPARLAAMRERAEQMEAALGQLPAEQQVLVREHLLAEEPMESLARRLDVPLSTAWYRFRRGAQTYAQALAKLTTRGAKRPGDS